MSLESIPLQAIGIVKSSRIKPTDDNWDSEQTYIELDQNVFKPEALLGLGDFSHVEIMFYMNQVAESEKQFGARHPRGDQSYPLIGIFAQRGKNRPNPIGLTVCKIVGIEGLKLIIKGLDAIDGTPVLDIKPWFSSFGPRGKVIEPEWVFRLMKEYWQKDGAEFCSPKIKEAIELRERNNFAAAIQCLNEAKKSYPNDPMVYYQIGWTHDALGKESDAVEPYQKALALGLKGEARKGLYVGLSSTLRCLGRYDEALSTIKKAVAEFPDEIVFKVFQALILNNLNQSDESINLLLTALLDTTSAPDIKKYDRALRFYSSRLREKFE